MTNAIVISKEAEEQLIELSSLKQLAERRKVRAMSEIIEDLLKLKKDLPYYEIGKRVSTGIASHGKSAERKRQNTVRNRKKKKR